MNFCLTYHFHLFMTSLINNVYRLLLKMENADFHAILYIVQRYPNALEGAFDKKNNPINFPPCFQSKFIW